MCFRGPFFINLVSGLDRETSKVKANSDWTRDATIKNDIDNSKFPNEN